MSNTVLQQAGMNAVVVGNGAIGSALVESLLQRENIEQIVFLQRSGQAKFDDPRVKHVNFDAERTDSFKSASATVHEYLDNVHLVFNTVGLLHSENQQPEKKLRSIEPDNLLRSFTVNAMLLPLLAQAFGDLLRHDERSVFASLSARVGSIEDNQLGGWYSYRASKAAHNMLLRTIANEWRISHRNAVIVALHPGTVHSRLSKPFISTAYKNTVHSPAESADHLLSVVSGLNTASSGGFFDWQGKSIPW